MKKWLALLLALTLLVGCTPAFAAKKLTTVVFPYIIYGEPPTDFDVVAAEINKYFEPMGIYLDIVPTPASGYEEGIGLMIAAGEQVDILTIRDSFLPGMVNKGMLLPLDEILAEHGQDVLKAYEENNCSSFLEASRVNGELYALPVICPKTVYNAVVFNKPIVDKYNLDISTIKTYKDIESFYEVVHAGEPQMTILGLDNIHFNFVGNQQIIGMDYFELLGDGIGVLTDPNSWTVSNLYEHPQYAELLGVLHSWYQKGYIDKDVATSTDLIATTWRTGNVFSYLVNTSDDPVYVAKNITQSNQTEAVVVQLNQEIVPYMQFITTIPVTCENIEATMKVLNAFYTNGELMDLLALGIEGRNYTRDEANPRILHPIRNEDGTSNYFYTLMYNFLGNRMNASIADTDNPNLIDYARNSFENATFSRSLGFSFDTTPVKNQYVAVTNVIAQYTPGLETGSLDPATALPEFIQKLKDAGIDEIIAEKQAQLDAWVALNGK